MYNVFKLNTICHIQLDLKNEFDIEYTLGKDTSSDHIDQRNICVIYCHI